MLPLVPLLGLAANAIPSLIGLINKDAGKVAGEVASIARGLFGTDDAGAVEKAIAADPAKALEWKLALAGFEDRERQRAHDETVKRIEDVLSARNQTVELAKQGSVIAWGAPVVSVIVLATFGFVLWLVLTAKVPSGQENLIYIMLGALTTMASAVVGYWVGSTAGSAQKNEMLAKMVPPK